MDASEICLPYDLKERILNKDISEFADLCRFMRFIDNKDERKELYMTPYLNIKRKCDWEELNMSQSDSTLLTVNGNVGVVPQIRNIYSVNVEYCSDPVTTFQHYRDIKMVTTGQNVGCSADSLNAAFPQMTHLSSTCEQLISGVVAANSNIKVVRFLSSNMNLRLVEENPNIKFYAILERNIPISFIEQLITKRYDNLYVEMMLNSSVALHYKPKKFNIDHLHIYLKNGIGGNFHVPETFRNIRKLTIDVHRMDIMPNITIFDFPNLECITLTVCRGHRAHFNILHVPFLRKLITSGKANVYCDPSTVRIYNPW
jgi:hypothetical protein